MDGKPCELSGRDRLDAGERVLQVNVEVFRQEIVGCCRCWNVTSAIFYLLAFPFLLAGLILLFVGTFLISIFGGCLCGFCYSRT